MALLTLTGFFSIVVGLIVGAIFAIGTIVLGVPKALVVVLTALGGAATVVAGALLIIGRIQVADLGTGLVGAIIYDNVFWLLAFAVVAALGIVWQTPDATPESLDSTQCYAWRIRLSPGLRARSRSLDARSGVASAQSRTRQATFRTSSARPQWKTRTATSTPRAASTRIAAPAIEASSVPALELRVDDERQRLRPALDVAGEHDRGAELAERSGPAHHQAGRQRRAGERHRDRAEHPGLRGAVDPRRILEVAVDPGDPGPCRPHEERRRHERLGEDDGNRRERDVDPGRLHRTAEQAAPARARAAARGPATAGGSTIGRSTIASTSHLPRNDRRARTNASGRPNDDGQDEAHRGRGEAERQRGENGRRAGDRGERSVERPTGR